MIPKLREACRWMNRTCRRKRVLLPLIGLGGPWLWLLWQFFGPYRAIPISQETTVLTAPLTPDGKYLDDLSVFRARHQHADARLASEDPWCLLSGLPGSSSNLRLALPKRITIVDSLNETFALHPELKPNKSPAYLWAIRDLPGLVVYELELSASEHPAAIKFLRDNEAWFNAVVNSNPTLPVLEQWQPAGMVVNPKQTFGLSQVMLERCMRYRDVISLQFLVRAAMYFQAGDFESGLEDLSIVHRAAAHCDTFCKMGWTIFCYLRRQANEQLINGLVLCPGINSEMVCRLNGQLPKEMEKEDLLRMLDTQQRLIDLDFVQELHRDPSVFLGNHLHFYGKMKPLELSYAVHRLDFGQLLQSQNRRVDEACEAMRKATFREQVEAFRVVNSTSSSWTSVEPAKRSFISTDYQLLAERFLASMSDYDGIPNELAQYVNSNRAAHLAIRLALWKSSFGDYPKSLSELKSLTNVPEVSDETFIDAFSNQPFRYERVGSKYRIISAATDMQFNSDSTTDQQWPHGHLLRE